MPRTTAPCCYHRRAGNIPAGAAVLFCHRGRGRASDPMTRSVRISTITAACFLDGAARYAAHQGGGVAIATPQATVLLATVPMFKDAPCRVGDCCVTVLLTILGPQDRTADMGCERGL